MEDFNNKLLEFEEVDGSFNLTFDNKYDIEDEYNRVLLLNTDIDGDVIHTLVYSILRYNRMDKKISPNDRKPIILYLNSLGGDVSAGLSLVDSIKLSRTPIYTVNLGVCYSMALYVFMAGHKRYSLPHSEYLLHEGQLSGWDATNKLRDLVEFHTCQVEKKIKNIVLNNSMIDSETYDKNIRKEWYFLPEEGKVLGIVDYIIGQDCDIDDIL